MENYCKAEALPLQGTSGDLLQNRAGNGDMAEFGEWFRKISGHPAPRPWQTDLARQELCGSRLIRIPTGLGKTEGICAAWSYHRVLNQDKNWPNRLVWCLPMRVLVEQTAEAARKLMEKMPSERRPSINIAMGGKDIGEWFLHPERPAIIIGTQDMLLSRALNRGYASSRSRWPMEFGLLSQDALWVMDEVQLMDVGLATSAQLQSFRDEDGSKSLRRCHTWWMSATLQQGSVHFSAAHANLEDVSKFSYANVLNIYHPRKEKRRCN